MGGGDPVPRPVIRAPMPMGMCEGHCLGYGRHALQQKKWKEEVPPPSRPPPPPDPPPPDPPPVQTPPPSRPPPSCAGMRPWGIVMPGGHV